MKKQVGWGLLCLTLLLSSCAVPREIETEAPVMTNIVPTSERTAVPISPEFDFACDAVFFGDSITADGNFDELFPTLRIVNLGVYGDTLEDLLARVGEVRQANPERIFLLGGINCLRPDNGDLCLEQYANLLDALQNACPKALICVQSVLPVAAEIDRDGLENVAVREFNAALTSLAKERGCFFADLYAAYEKNGALNPGLTRDGLHLNFNAYGPWADIVRPILTVPHDD